MLKKTLNEASSVSAEKFLKFMNDGGFDIADADNIPGSQAWEPRMVAYFPADTNNSDLKKIALYLDNNGYKLGKDLGLQRINMKPNDHSKYRKLEIILPV